MNQFFFFIMCMVVKVEVLSQYGLIIQFMIMIHYYVDCDVFMCIFVEFGCQTEARALWVPGHLFLPTFGLL